MLINRLIILLFGCMPVMAAAATATAEDLATARALLLGGKHAEAAEIFADSARTDPVAAMGLARCLCAQGKRDEAVAALSTLADGRAEIQAELASLALQRGDCETAGDCADEALRLDRDELQARWVRAELARLAGRLDEAERGYADLVRHYNDHDLQQAESLRWIGLAAARYARWNRLDDQFNFLVNELYPDALKLEPRYWLAPYEAGLLFLEKYNKADAAAEFQAALELNPNAADVHVAMARLALQNRDFEAARISLDRAIEINPRLRSAWLGKADLAWANFQLDETLDLLKKKALPLNPLDEETLGRIAACYLLLDQSAEKGQATRFARLVEEVTERNAHAGTFFLTLADQLADRKKLRQAEPFYVEAIRRMPRMLGPRSHLGLLYMAGGDEAKARRLLDEAFDADPFNVRVKNSLEVLDLLDRMATLETEHFLIRYDGERDELLARYAARHLEAIYPEMCRKFGYRPPEKPLIEIFNSDGAHDGQQWFSTRLIGLPYLGLVAACTGRLVAMASPNDPRSARHFGWARVLEHELAHVVTLQQTDFNIPHWFTEGVAVFYEDRPRPQRWNELLMDRVPKGRLFNLRTLNFGFSRPKNGSDWQMAYCQAELYVEYMLNRFGSGQPRKLLAAYSRGQSTDEALPEIFGLSLEQFEQGYVDYLRELVAGMSSLARPSGADFEDLLRSHREHPDDADTAAALAVAYLNRDAGDEALELARNVLKKHPKHQQATYVVARLRIAKKSPEEAVALLEGCLLVDGQVRDDPHPSALNLLAALKLKAEHYGEAAELYATGQRLDPINLKWTKSLARVYLLSDNDERLAAALRRIADADADDLATRKKLAEMAIRRDDYDEAAKWANQAVYIDVMDADSHRTFAEALIGSHNFAEAIEEFEVAIELDPATPYLRYALADAQIEAGDHAKAADTLKELLEMAPDYPGAEFMLENLESIDQ
ncbi:MAG: tetratricopeptide repeat protein [Thermoguttaceae bacterium]